VIVRLRKHDQSRGHPPRRHPDGLQRPKTIEVNNTRPKAGSPWPECLVYASGSTPGCGGGCWPPSPGPACCPGTRSSASGRPAIGLGRRPCLEADASAVSSSGDALPASYKEGLRAPVADLKNTGPRAGGSITAALFLQDSIEAGPGPGPPGHRRHGSWRQGPGAGSSRSTGSRAHPCRVGKAREDRLKVAPTPDRNAWPFRRIRCVPQRPARSACVAVGDLSRR